MIGFIRNRRRSLIGAQRRCASQHVLFLQTECPGQKDVNGITHKLAHVWRWWLSLIFASRLDLQLVGTYGTLVSEIMAHSPPLSFIVSCIDTDRETTADEEDILLVLGDRVHRIRLRMPALS